MSLERFDFVVIGAGAAGEAAAHYARGRGASVAIVERDLFGGSCPFWACIPSKTLLHCAAVRAHGGDYPWAKASARRDYMINRVDRDYPDDRGHVRSLERAGATPVRGTARLAGPGRVEVRAAGAVTRTLAARDVIIAVGSVGKVPNLDGLVEAGFWTNREATSTRALPRSMVILGAGPSGVEIAQYFARYDVRTTLVASRRVNPTDHRRSSEALAEALRRSRVDVRENARATRVRPRASGADHVVELSDGSSVAAEVIQLSVGRTSAPALGDLGLDTIGVRYDGGDSLAPDASLRVADHTFVAGDVMDRELSTHLGHYEGELAVRVALGDDVRVDLSAVPRAVYTEPETAAVGLRLEQAREKGLDAFEETAAFATTSKGFIEETDLGHATIVVDRAAKRLLGAFIAAPGASEAIHAAVLALKLRTPIDTLAQTITAFPTTTRVLGGLFASAAAKVR